jgi:hypothetical protein
MIVTALLLAALGAAIAVALALWAWTLRRLVAKFEPSRSPVSRAERLFRSFAAGLSAVLALVAAVRVSLDSSYELGGGIVLILVAAGAAATTISLALAWSGPSSRIPYLAGVLALSCTLLLLASSPLAFAVSACACTTPAVPYVHPTLAGMDGTTWAMISAVGTPVLLLGALMGRS